MVAAGSWWFAGRAAIVICSQGAQLVRGGDGAAIVICSQGAQCVCAGESFEAAPQLWFAVKVRAACPLGRRRHCDLQSRCAVRARWGRRRYCDL